MRRVKRKCSQCGEEKPDCDFPDNGNVCITCKVSGAIEEAGKIIQKVEAIE